MGNSVKQDFQTALKAAFDKQSAKKTKPDDPDLAVREFVADFSKALFTLLEGQTVTLDAPLSDLFKEAVPVPMDGGSAINIKYAANAEKMDNKSKVTLT